MLAKLEGRGAYHAQFESEPRAGEEKAGTDRSCERALGRLVVAGLPMPELETIRRPLDP